MKKILISLLVCFSGVCFGQTFPVNNINITGQLQVAGSPGTAGYVLQSNGAATPSWISPSTISSPVVATNAALQATATTFSSQIWRLGFAAQGDSPPLLYTASSSSPCSLNGGAGDNGAQVQSADGKCWIASFPSHTIDLTDYGAVGNGVTDSTTAITNAVAYASSNAMPIAIVGAFKTSASIPGLHSQNVEWIGNGSIISGSSGSFYPNPPANALNANTIYVSQTGSDANDGLSSSNPIATLNHFFAIVGHYNPPGTCSNWAATLAAGSYAGATVPYGLSTCAPGNATLSLSDGHIQINGPQPSGSLGTNVQPIAFIDGNFGPSGQTFGLGIDGNSSIQMTNVYLRNWNLECIYANPFTDLTLINVWFAGCLQFGVNARQSHVQVIGGTLDGSAVTAPAGMQTGLSFLNSTVFTVTSIDQTTGNGTLMKNMSISAFQNIENATGHLDYATLTNSVIGIETAEASHVQLDNTTVTNNSTAWLEKDASSSYLSSGVTISGNGNGNATLPIVVQSVPWSPYTPTVSCASGTITSYTVAGSYTLLSSNVVAFQAALNVSTLGSCTGQVSIGLPKAAAGRVTIPGAEIVISGNVWYGTTFVGTTMNINRYDDAPGLASGGNYVFNGTYQSQ